MNTDYLKKCAAKLLTEKQMSEAFLNNMFLALSGGLQDAYTYLCRGKVYANAQTGNIVLLSTYLCNGEWAAAGRYLVPVLAFMAGIFAAECVHRRFRRMERVHWRQMILLAEIVLLAAVGLYRLCVTQSSALAEGGFFLLLCALCVSAHAGADVPQGPGPRLCQYHVHR